MVLDLNEDARWKALVAAFDAREALGSPLGFGSARWNRAFDAFARARDAVVADPALLARARELGTLTSNPGALQLLWELTSPPFHEYEHVAPILADSPRGHRGTDGLATSLNRQARSNPRR
ncbi:hypothetical protein [Microbacterium invictum]|uniref:Uncharacterized protein n=1 Tax=Microbacterium invictum TaxID=515415 RepID=A0AA40SRT9_9MICO|nr:MULTISPECIES: hypothetical protein [Microbacterium]MBB4141232.1 hypothetical protein [Microbacterium invictum]